jgi:hypothetical protein
MQKIVSKAQKFYNANVLRAAISSLSVIGFQVVAHSELSIYTMDYSEYPVSTPMYRYLDYP